MSYIVLYDVKRKICSYVLHVDNIPIISDRVVEDMVFVEMELLEMMSTDVQCFSIGPVRENIICDVGL